MEKSKEEKKKIMDQEKLKGVKMTSPFEYNRLIGVKIDENEKKYNPIRDFDKREMTLEKKYSFKQSDGSHFFGFEILRKFSKGESSELKKRIDKKRKDYFQLYDQIDIEDQTDFTLDFIDNLEKLKKLQEQHPRCSKHIFRIDNFINEIKSNNREIDLSGNDKDKDYDRKCFTSYKASKLFEYFADRVNKKTQLIEFNFIYQLMIRDELIQKEITPTKFIKWLENYDPIIKLNSDFRTFKEVYKENSDRYKNYLLLLNMFKLKPLKR